MATKIDISQANYESFNKIKELIYKLGLLDDISIGMDYSEFGERVYKIINEADVEKHKSFKDFVLDTKKGEEIMSIDYKEYEKLIEANLIYKTISMINIKSLDVDFITYDILGLFIEAMVKAYKK